MKAFHSTCLLMGLLGSVFLLSSPSFAQRGRSEYQRKFMAPETVASKVGRFTSRWFHQINIDAHLRQMQKDGVTERKFWSGISASGALYTGQPDSEYLLEDRALTLRSGAHVFPWSATLLANGAYRIKAGLFDATNINLLYRSLSKNPLLQFVDNAELFAITFDRGVEFSNPNRNTHDWNDDRYISSLQVTIFSLEPTIPIVRSADKQTYLQLRGKVRYGGAVQEIPLNGQDAIVLSDFPQRRAALEVTDARDFREAAEFGAGIGAGTTTRSGFQADFRATYISGYQEGKYFDPGRVQANTDADEQYQSDLAEFPEAQAAYDQKLQAWQSVNPGYSEEDFVRITKTTRPEEPKAPKAGQTLYEGRRVYGQVNFNAEASMPIGTSRQGRAIRLGGGLNWQLPLRDHFAGSGGTTVNLIPYRTLFKGTVFVRF